MAWSGKRLRLVSARKQSPKKIFLLENMLIVNTPTFEPPKEDHITLVEAVDLKEQVGAKGLVLTNINHKNRPHDELEVYARQFPGVTVAYDGMSLDI